MKPRTHTTTLALSIAGGGETELRLVIGYTVSPYIAATQIDPAEGGEVEITSVNLAAGEKFRPLPFWLVGSITDDTELHATLRAEWADAEASEAERAADMRREQVHNDRPGGFDGPTGAD